MRPMSSDERILADEKKRPPTDRSSPTKKRVKAPSSRKQKSRKRAKGRKLRPDEQGDGDSEEEDEVEEEEEEEEDEDEVDDEEEEVNQDGEDGMGSDKEEGEGQVEDEDEDEDVVVGRGGRRGAKVSLMLMPPSARFGRELLADKLRPKPVMQSAPNQKPTSKQNPGIQRINQIPNHRQLHRL